MNAPHEEAVEFAKQSKRENRVYVGNLSYDVRYRDLMEFMRGGGWGNLRSVFRYLLVLGTERGYFAGGAGGGRVMSCEIKARSCDHSNGGRRCTGVFRGEGFLGLLTGQLVERMVIDGSFLFGFG